MSWSEMPRFVAELERLIAQRKDLLQLHAMSPDLDMSVQARKMAIVGGQIDILEDLVSATRPTAPLANFDVPFGDNIV